jgi:hypothetical protein
MEGMNAPMGGFQSYGGAPRAVTITARGLQEVAPGTFSTALRLPQAGDYEFVLLLEEPRVVQCFTFTATSDAPAVQEGPPTGEARFLSTPAEARAGEALSLELAVVGADGQVLGGRHDIEVLVLAASGTSSQRVRAQPREGGTYEVTVTLQRPGPTRLMAATSSRELHLTSTPLLIQVSAN